MKFFLALLNILLFFLFTSFATEGYKIEVKFNTLADSSFVFGHYYDAKVWVNDTILIDKKGMATIEGKTPLPQGIYVIYFPGTHYFDMLIGQDQTFTITVPEHTRLDEITVSGALESEQYKYYQQKFNVLQNAIKQNRQAQTKVTNSQDSIQLATRLKNLSTNFSEALNQVIDVHIGSFLSAYFKAQKQINIPHFEVEVAVENRDEALSAKRYAYYKAHYFDYFDFSDHRLLYTPFFSKKIDTYMKTLVAQMPDSLIKEGIQLIEKSREDSLMFKYMTQHMMNFAVQSKMMGMDAMVLAIGKKYYLSGQASWVDEKYLEELRENILRTEPTLAGKTAHNFKMLSNTGVAIELHEIEAPFTIVVFWEPDCGYCNKQIPILKSIMEYYIHYHGVKVLAVYTQKDKAPWQKFIDDQHLEDWVHIYDPENTSNFRYYYNIEYTPIIYILDREKKIVAKRMAAENLKDFFEHEIQAGRL